MARSSIENGNPGKNIDAKSGRPANDGKASRSQPEQDLIRVGICDASAADRYGLETIFRDASGIEIAATAISDSSARRRASADIAAHFQV